MICFRFVFALLRLVFNSCILDFSPQNISKEPGFVL